MVLEGGGMRGVYTAGVLDVFMENKIKVDGVVGVSAGAVFGCNYKSGQIGRTIRYNKKYCKDPRYASVKSLLTTGDLFGTEFCYHELPNKLDIFDAAAYRKNPVEFYVTSTDIHTGRPIYHLCMEGDNEDIKWMQSSASMPLVSKVVSIDGYDMLDGGISDSIPINWFRTIGFEKNIVVLTRPSGYRKKKSKGNFLFRAILGKYPMLVDAMEKRYLKYNETLDKLEALEEKEEVILISPSQKIQVGRVEKDPEKLQVMYDLGRHDATMKLEQIKCFVENKG